MKDNQMQNIAIFAAGCFWGIEAYFRSINGVSNAICGYTDGLTQNPTYRQVCSGTTGHAEAVQITFDDKTISYDELLQHFWKCHNPCQLNRQGPDVGTQYRSAIFTRDQNQQTTAQKSKQNAQKQFNDTIATEIKPHSKFYPAEEYHQNYFAKNNLAACHI